MVTQRDELFARRLKELRRKHKIKQYTAAALLDLPGGQQQYSDLENGKRAFSENLLAKICDVFSVELIDFIAENDDAQLLNQISDTFDPVVLMSLPISEMATIYKKMLLAIKQENQELKRQLVGTSPVRHLAIKA